MHLFDFDHEASADDTAIRSEGNSVPSPTSADSGPRGKSSGVDPLSLPPRQHADLETASGGGLMSKATVKAQVEALADDYGQQAYLLYAMGLETGIDDYESLSRDHVIDGPGDRKIDFFHLDTGARRAIVVQAYLAEDWEKREAPASKAAELNTAGSWLLDRELGEIPEARVKKAAEELRDALAEGSIDTVDFLFVHNLPESPNVEQELKTVEDALRQRLGNDASWKDAEVVVQARECGINYVAALQERESSTIRVTDDVELRSSTTPQKTEAKGWRAVFGTISGDQLSQLAQKYGPDLYSSNVRDYLGSRNTWRNINSQIQRTARDAPANFWVFNNGVTVLTNSVERSGKKIKCQGISVVNGAQTVGSLAALEDVDLKSVAIQVRVVEANEVDLATDIIRFNNTQNPIKAWELRAIDPVQSRITDDFKGTFGLAYQLRRGTARWAASDVHFEKLAPWLSAFYGDPQTPYRNRRELYESDKRYSELFNHATNVSNLLFVYRIGEAVGALKDELKEREARGEATESEKKLYGYFQYGAFQYVAIYLVARLLRAACSGVAGDFERLVTLADIDALRDRDNSVAAIKGIVRFAVVGIPVHVREDAYAAFRSRDEVEKIAEQLEVSVLQQEALNPGTLQKIGDVVGLR